VQGEQSAEWALDAAHTFAVRVGKEPIRCADTPGFVVNRILIPILNDAVRVLDDRTATAEDIDKAMKLGAGWPMGPLALIDLIGIDVLVHAANALSAAYDDPRMAPPPRIDQMLETGLLGRKSGRGFYLYDGDQTVPTS
jgi:3-hydroxybutyryl-CoA dehydrogenase